MVRHLQERGLSVDEISDELKVSPAFTRRHMRSERFENLRAALRIPADALRYLRR